MMATQMSLQSAQEAWKQIDALGVDGVRSKKGIYVTVNGNDPTGNVVIRTTNKPSSDGTNDPAFKTVRAMGLPITSFACERALTQKRIDDYFRTQKSRYRDPELLATQQRIGRDCRATGQTTVFLDIDSQIKSKASYVRPAQVFIALLKALRDNVWTPEGCVTIAFRDFLNETRAEVTIEGDVAKPFMGQIADLLVEGGVNTNQLRMVVRTDVGDALRTYDRIKTRSENAGQHHRPIVRFPVDIASNPCIGEVTGTFSNFPLLAEFPDLESILSSMPLTIDGQYSNETVDEFLEGLKKEDLAKIWDKIHLTCLPSEDDMGRQLWIVDKGRLAAWKDEFQPVDRDAEPIKSFLEQQETTKKDVIKYYEENKESLVDMRTMAGQERFGKSVNKPSCSLLIHSKDLSDKAMATQLAEVFLVLAKAINSGRLESDMVLSLSFTRFKPEKDSRVKIITATTVTGALLKQIVEILLENDVYLGILHLKVKSDVAWVMDRYLDAGGRDYKPFTPFCEGMLDKYEELTKKF
ncbi:unnamed protein product, partial [Mesorhabditis spiculigera]